MIYKDVSCAAIHDLSGVGKCSLTVALPVLSACGVETAVLPTAVLSTHTGGFTGYTFRDLSEDLLPIAAHWKQVGCRFSALYSGFLGSAGQTKTVAEIFRMLGEGSLLVVDPVLGDGGRLYATITEELAAGMAELCQKADLVIPNLTETSYLLGTPYQEGEMTPEEVGALLGALRARGPKLAVLTGVRCGGKLGSASMDAAGKMEMCLLEEIPGSYHGTGDLFASTLVGGLLNGMTLGKACRLATEFTHQVIVTTREKSKDIRFGPKFEVHLPELAARVENFRRENHSF
ncbi:pyridoxamine kinase [Acutalibacter sp. 1XD8-33]|uniref:pyridoxamine kinase n=1 Tax=Acutalibacter sp. 1XD8-33 TaxID=2320081 RepID=UPI001FA98EF9|nr:pyridoxamine kinase [Acutalibacter sp. 1XD8-33]